MKYDDVGSMGDGRNMVTSKQQSFQEVWGAHEQVGVNEIARSAFLLKAQILERWYLHGLHGLKSAYKKLRACFDCNRMHRN